MNATDLTLLERFVSHREEAAFVALVKRHGPRVQGTCRRVLHNEHDVEDVFQATFLLLARKAAVVAWQESIGSWLCAVAHRLALSARADASRHQSREASFTTFGRSGAIGGLPDQFHPLADADAEAEGRELYRLVHDELLQLPEKYRAPVVLCDLEGLTHQEAAEELGWPSGSISRRLSRARTILRQRLSRRGVTLAIALVGCGLAAFLATRGPHRDDQEVARVRQVMASLRPLTYGVPGLTSRSKVPDDDSDADPAQILILARRVARASAEIKMYDPGEKRDHWQTYTDEMAQSAVQLAQAAQGHDQLAMLSAARRLDAVCLKCHEVFSD